MASIIKRKKKYSVVYTYTDENGNKRQKWETFETNAEAKKRKLQVEYEQESGTFIPPSAKTVNDLLDEYMSIYGVNTWAMSTYESRKSLIANYIRPLIGDMKLEDVSPRIMDKYYRDLLSVKAVSSKYVKARTEYLTPHTVREVHKTLRNAFNQAVKWELMTRNPVEHATLPKEEHKTRDIWTAEVLQKALEACDDDILRLAMKSVQGDSGHAQVKMVADVYSHIIDDDRRLNAERMEAAFYSGRQATPEPVQPAATESSADDKELLLKLLQNPEMAALLKSLAKTL